MKQFWYVMTSSGLSRDSRDCASFGPFDDLALAKLVADRLGKRGVGCSVASEEEARNVDVHGVAALRAKNPEGVTWG